MPIGRPRPFDPCAACNPQLAERALAALLANPACTGRGRQGRDEGRCARGVRRDGRRAVSRSRSLPVPGRPPGGEDEDRSRIELGLGPCRAVSRAVSGLDF